MRIVFVVDDVPATAAVKKREDSRSIVLRSAQRVHQMMAIVAIVGCEKIQRQKITKCARKDTESDHHQEELKTLAQKFVTAAPVVFSTTVFWVWCG